MKIVFLSHATLCSGFVVGSHQLAKALISNGHTVFHISSPVSFIHIFFGKERRHKFFCALKDRKHIDETFGFIDFIPISLVPVGSFKWLDSINNWLINKQIVQHIGTGKTDLVLIDQPQFYNSLGLFDHATKVYRPTDVYSEMGGTKLSLPEREIIKKVQGVIGTSRRVFKHIQTLTDKPGITVTNGVDYDLFSKPFEQATQTSRLDKCIYVGAIDFRFDLTTAILLAENNPDIVFDYYGPVTIDIDNKLPKNLVFHGKIDYDKIPALLIEYKYSIIPMNNHKGNDGRSPMKLYEFLAAGVPVLSRKTISIHKEILPGVLLYKNNDDVLTKFNELKEIVSEHSTDEFRLIASKASWKEKARIILDYCSTIKQVGQ